ncbi:ATP phosphoribosyltransferase regulatory subunit [Gudongella sp. SC589]|jgi:ATP phosphoribosyltransferase regulatory subunit|uniref:ATP phosphoribosyltransferase regulatory subunit n=1 Tax=Gudongella sp. SC589 TaxID=3385990 RepID=UPI003904C396
MRFTSITEELEVTKFKKRVEREFEGYFEKRGFSLIEPRIFQKYDLYVRSNFRQDSSKTVKVLSGNSRIYILRPDITTNVLGEIFSKWDGEPPLKVYYNSKIYLNKPGGKILENYQMGIESLGEDVLAADQEIVEMATSLMGTLGKPVILELGSSKYLDGIFKELELDLDEESEVRDLISKKNRYGLRIKLKSLGLEGTALEHILHLQGDMEEVIRMAKAYPMNREMSEAIDELEKLMESFNRRYTTGEIKFDLSMLPDLDYYDGIIFKGYCLGVPNKILSGGRYDRLTEEFGLRVPAIGFMIDLDLVTSIRIEEGR